MAESTAVASVGAAAATVVAAAAARMCRLSYS